MRSTRAKVNYGETDDKETSSKGKRTRTRSEDGDDDFSPEVESSRKRKNLERSIPEVVPDKRSKTASTKAAAPAKKSRKASSGSDRPSKKASTSKGPEPKRPRQVPAPKGETAEQEVIRLAHNRANYGVYKQKLFEFNGEEKSQRVIGRDVKEARVESEGIDGVVPVPGAKNYDIYWKDLLPLSELTKRNGGKKVTVTTTTWNEIEGITYYSADGPTRGRKPREVLLTVYKRGPDPTDPEKPPATDSDESWIGGIFQSAALAARLMGVAATSITKNGRGERATGVVGTYKNCGCHWRFASEKKEGEGKEKVEEE